MRGRRTVVALAIGVGIGAVALGSAREAAVAIAAMAGIAIASRGRARALERADRWQRLAELAALGASCRSETEIAEAAAHALDDLVDSHDVVIDVTPGDSGLAVDITNDRWLTLRPRGFPRGVHPTDLAQLRATGDVARAAIENLRLRRALEVAATTDGLTGTLNRASFDVELANWCARANREHTTFVLAIVDGNRLKHVNDTHGHQGGDQAIRFLADRLRAGLRTGDVVARLGGDEFAVLAAGTSDVVAVCSRLLDALAAERCPLGPVSAAVGGAARGDDGVTPEQLFATADRRMYVHKAATRR